MKKIAKRLALILATLITLVTVFPITTSATVDDGYGEAQIVYNEVLPSDIQTDFYSSYISFIENLYGNRVIYFQATRYFGQFGGFYLAEFSIYIDDNYFPDIVVDKNIGGYLFCDLQIVEAVALFDGERAYSLEAAWESGEIPEDEFARIVDSVNEKHGVDYPEPGTIPAALYALRMSAYRQKPTPMILGKYDMNLDGKIDVTDALALLRTAAKLD